MSIEIEGLTPFKTGKVRDIYKIENQFLIVATDRISAFDYILPNEIPDKGKVLNQLSLFWFDLLKDIVPTHLITADVEHYPESLKPFTKDLKYRSMIVKEAEVVPFECVARGYIEGSGWKDYQSTGKICGIDLPSGLRRGDKLPSPIFTPATKEDSGHDINIDIDYMANEIGRDKAESLKKITLDLYSTAADYALSKGIIIADTKFEFGIIDGEILLIDEVLTPDSSRFWPADNYNPGAVQLSYDKQFVREYLESINWDKKPPVPELSGEIIRKTREKYLDAYIKITGKTPDFAN